MFSFAKSFSKDKILDTNGSVFAFVESQVI
jgi:hypothetical protein